MSLFVLVVVLTLSTMANTAYACKPAPGFPPATPSAAFYASEIVIHAKVLSQDSSDRHNVKATIEVLEVLKGNFSENTVNTSAPSSCGIGRFEIGREYVFFFGKSGNRFVGIFNQPLGTTEELLSAVKALSK